MVVWGRVGIPGEVRIRGRSLIGKEVKCDRVKEERKILKDKGQLEE